MYSSSISSYHLPSFSLQLYLSPFSLSLYLCMYPDAGAECFFQCKVPWDNWIVIRHYTSKIELKWILFYLIVHKITNAMATKADKALLKLSWQHEVWAANAQAITPFSLQGEGKYHIEPEASHRATDAGNKESRSRVTWVCVRVIGLYGKKYLPSERTVEKHYTGVCGCTRGMCATTRILQTHTRE